MVAIVAGQGLGLVNTSVGLLGGVGQSGSAGQGRAGENVFFNAANGNLVVQRHDEWLVGAGPDVGLLRTYNSQATLDGDNNDNWRLGFARNITVSGSNLIRTAEDGSQSTYVLSGSAWVNTDGDGGYDIIQMISSTTLVWTDGSTQAKETYGLSGGYFRLDSVADADGKTLTLAYNGDNVITQVADSSGDVLKISYYTGTGATRNIKDITTESKVNGDGTGGTKVVKRVSYTYDSLNRLTKVSVDLELDASNSVADGKVYEISYGYVDSTTRLAWMTQTDRSTLSFDYEADGRLKTIVDWRGDNASSILTSISYNGNETTVETKPYGATTALQTVKFVYEPASAQSNPLQLRSVQVLQANGAYAESAFYTYDTAGNVQSARDGRGKTTYYGYDSYGNRSYERDADNRVVSRTFSTDGKNLLLSETLYTVADLDGAGSGGPSGAQTTRYAYDAQNHLRFVVSPEGRVTEYTYFAAGTAGNAGGLRSASIQYLTRYPVETANDYSLSALQSWLNPIAPATPPVRAQREDYEYNYRGQLNKTTSFEVLQSGGAGDTGKPLRVVQYVYDQAGNLLESRQILDTGYKSTAYLYDGLNRVTRSTDGENVSVNTVYWDAGDQTTVGPVTVLYRANNRVTVQSYDRGGLLVGLQEYDSAAASNGLQTAYTYDKAGRLRKILAQGQPTYFIYDPAGRKVAQVSPERELTIFVYNGNGQEVATIRRARLVDVSKLAGDATQLTLAYVDPGVDPATPPQDRYGFKAYDNSGRLQRSIDATGAVVQYTYDGAGRLVGTTAYAKLLDTSAQMAALKYYAEVYAAYDMPVELVESQAAAVTALASDPADRVTRQFYDNDGRLVATLDAEGTLAESIYDNAGRLVQTRRYAVPTAPGARASGTLADLRPPTLKDEVNDEITFFFYSARGELAGSLAVIGYSAGNPPQTPSSYQGYLSAYAYDRAGNRSAEVKYAATVSYTGSEALSALVTAADAAALAPQNQKTLYQYDGNNRLKKVIALTKAQEALDSNYSYGNTTTYTYDAAGNLTQTVTAYGATEGRSTMRRYDALGRVTHELGGVGVQKLVGASDLEAVWNTYGTRYFYDADGRMTATLSPNGSNAAGNRTLYYYDKDGRQTHSINALGEVVKYTYNAFGERSAERHYAGRIASADLAGLGGGLNTDGALATALASSGITSQSAQDSESLTWYNALGQAYVLVDARGFNTVLDYNAFGQVKARTQQIDARHTPSETVRWMQTQYTYNRLGQAQYQVDDVTGGYSRNTVVRTYDSLGRMNAMLDGRGNATGFAYDRLGRTVMVTDPTGIQRQTTYDAFSRVLTQVDGTGKTTSYAYDAAKREMKVTTPDLVETVTETNRHGEIVKVALKQTGDPLQRVTVYEYDSDGRVLQVTGAQGTTAQHRIKTDYDQAGRVWKITDERDVVTELAYDAANRVLTRTVDPGGTGALSLVTRYRYDGQGRAVWTQEPSGTWTKTDFDANGQAVVVTVDAGDPDNANAGGLKLSTEYTYDARGRVLTVAQGVDLSQSTAAARYAVAQVTRYVYDALGRRVQEIVDPARSPLLNNPAIADDRTSALNLVTSYVYDGNDNVVARVDPLGKVTRYVYDKDNRQVYAIDATGAVTQTEYDREGRATRVTAYAGRLDTAALPNAVDRETVATLVAALEAPSRDQVAYRVYTDGGRLKYAVDALNYVTAFEYDAAGNVVKSTRYNNPDAVVARQSNPAGVSAEYASFAVTLPTADPNYDRVEQTVYDAANRATYSIDALQGVTGRRFDAAGNVIEVRRYVNKMQGTLTANGTVNVTADPALDQITRTVYDKANRAIFTIDAENYVTETRYDKTSRVLSQTRYADTLKGSFTDNKAPDVLDSGTSSTNSYVVRSAAQATSQDVLTEYGYDKAGRLTSTTSASGGAEASATTRAYDKASRLKTVTESASATAAETSTLYDYDTAGRLKQETRDNGGTAAAVTRYVLDPGGNRAQIISANGVALAESNDDWAKAARKALGAPELVANLTPEQKTAFLARYSTYQEFDAVGRVVKVIDPFNGVTATTYDVFGNVVKVTDPKGVSGYFYFDKRNQAVLHVDPEGNAVATAYGAFGTADSIRRYVTPVLGALSENVLPTIAAKDPATAAGDQVTVVKHDKLGRQIEIVDATNAVEKTSYDWLGNRTSLTNKVGGIFGYTYDRLGRVKTETLPAKAIKLNTTTGAIERETNGDPKKVAVVNEYTYDSRGNKTKLVEAKDLYEQRTTEYVYDRLNRLVKQTGEAVDIYSVENGAETQKRPVETRKYDTHGNLIEQVDPNGARTLAFYDALNRKTAEIRATTRNADGSQSGTLTAYEYDDAGNMVAQRVYGTAVALPAAGGVRPALANGPAADMHATGYVYDANNRLVETRIAGIATGAINPETGNYEIRTQDLVTRRAYDENGNVVIETDARGGRIYYYYDKAGNKVATIDAERYLSAWSYDTSARVVMEYRFAEKVSPDVVLSPGLDLGTLVFRTNENTRATSYGLDKLGRVLKQTVHNVQAATISDAGVVTIPSSGQLVATTTFEYNGLGQVFRRTEATGEVLNWTYDEQGRVLSEKGATYIDETLTTTDKSVTPTKDTEYNGLGLAVRRLERGRDAGEADDRITYYTYDKNGLLASETDTTGAVKLYSHDAAGHQTRVSTPRYSGDLLQGPGKLYVDRQQRGASTWAGFNSQSSTTWGAGLTFSAEVSLGESSTNRELMIGLQSRTDVYSGNPPGDPNFRRYQAYFRGDDLYVAVYGSPNEYYVPIPRSPQQKLKNNATYVVQIRVEYTGTEYLSKLAVYEKGTDPASGWTHQITNGASPWPRAVVNAASLQSAAAAASDAFDNIQITGSGGAVLFSDDFSSTSATAGKFLFTNNATNSIWQMDDKWQSIYSTTDVGETQYDLAGREVRRHTYSSATGDHAYTAASANGKLSVSRTGGAGTWSQVTSKAVLPWSTGTVLTADVQLGADATGRNFKVSLETQPTGTGMPAIDANFRRFGASFVGDQLKVQSYFNNSSYEEIVVPRSPQQTLKANATYVVQISFLNTGGQYYGRLKVYEKGQDPSTGWSVDKSFGTSPWVAAYVHSENWMGGTANATRDAIDNIVVTNNGQVTFSEDFSYSDLAADKFNITDNAGYAYLAQDDIGASRKLAGLTAETRYDAYGQVVAKGRNGGFQETAQYDAAGRVTRATGQDGVPKIFVSDANGNVTLTLKPPANGDTPTDVVALFNGVAALNAQDFRTLANAKVNATVSDYSARNQLTDTYEAKADQVLASMNAINLTMGSQAAQPYDIDPPAGVLKVSQSISVGYTLSSKFQSDWFGGGSNNDRTVQSLTNRLDLYLSNSGMNGSKYRIVLHVDAGHFHRHGTGYVLPYDKVWEVNDPPVGQTATLPNPDFTRGWTADYRSDYGSTGGANYTLRVYKMLNDLDPTEVKEIASFAGEIPGLSLPPYFPEVGQEYIDGSWYPVYGYQNTATVASSQSVQTANPQQMTISSLPGKTFRVFMQYRIKNAAPGVWQTTGVQYLSGAATFTDSLLSAIGPTAIPADTNTTLEFNLYAVDPNGRVISTQSGEVAVSRDATATPKYSYVSVPTGLKVQHGQSGQMFWSPVGSINQLVYAQPVLAKEAVVPSSATIRYRAMGQGAWTSSTGSRYSISTVNSVAGWFSFNPPAAGTVNEYIIDFYDDVGRLISSATGYVTKTGSDYASTALRAYQQRPSLMHFSNVPLAATKAKLNYKITGYTFDAQGNAVADSSPTIAEADLLRGADGNFDWDAALTPLDPSRRYVIDFTFKALDNADLPVATLVGRESIDPLGKLPTKAAMTASVTEAKTPTFVLSGPKQLKLTHSLDIGKLASKATIYYRPAGSTAAPLSSTVTGTPVNGVVGSFSFDLSGVSGSAADMEVYVRYTKTDNSPIPGIFTFSLSNATGQNVATLAGESALDAKIDGFGANVYSANSASSNLFRISGPKIKLVHTEKIGKLARTAHLYYRKLGPNGSPTFTELTPPVTKTPNANGVVEFFEFDLTSLLDAGDYTEFDIYYRYEDGSSPANNVLVPAVVGAPNLVAPTQAQPILLRVLPQAAYEVTASSANIAMVGLASAATAHRQQVYNAYGDVVQEYTPLAMDKIRKREQELGRALSEADRAVYGTTLRYDGAGRVIEKIDAQADAVQDSGFVLQNHRASTQYVYDKQGRLIQQLDANGNKTKFVLLKAGNGERKVWKELSARSTDANPDLGLTTYAYDVFGDQRRKTVEAGTIDVVTDFAYDKMHRVVRADLPFEAGNVRPTDLYYYDSVGNRVAHQTSPDAAANANGSFGANDVRVYTDRTYYDGLARSVRTRSAEGLETATTYQGQGGLDYRKVVDENGKTSEEWLDYAGRVLRRINLGGQLYKYAYNLAGNLTRQMEVSSFSDTNAKSGGQDIRYEYFPDGTLSKILDIALQTTTIYGYDLNGNKTFEGYQSGSGGTVYQASNATYDALGRITSIDDQYYSITYTYDKVGNRRSVVAVQRGGSSGTGTAATLTYWYAYDQLNRLKISMGELVGGAANSDTGVSRIQKGSTKGVDLTYDSAGNRWIADYASGSKEYYTYTTGGHLTEVRKDTAGGDLLSVRTNDLLGRVKTYVEFRPANGPAVAYSDSQAFAYNADGRVTQVDSSSTKAGASRTVTDISYNDLFTDKKTSLQQWSLAVSTTPGNSTPTNLYTKYVYAYFDNAQQSQIKVNATNATIKEASWGRWAHGVSKFEYDVNGHVKNVGDSRDDTGTDLRNIAFINNAQGLILNRTETGSSPTVPTQSYFYFDGKRVAEWGNNPGIGSIDYSTALAAPRSDDPKDRYRNIGPITSNFDQNYQPINSTYPSFVPGAYKVRAGETLQSIARAVWGDASLWYLIADANGIPSGQQPREGQLLAIPNKVTNFHNTSETSRVYNPGEVMGDVSPTLPDAPHPPLPKLDNGCGVLGQIIMIVVAVVATLYTAGSAAGLFGATTANAASAATTAALGAGTSSFGATLAAGAAALGAGGMGAVALGAMAGAVGSIASQLAGMAMGNVKEFSWSGVALGAIGGAASAGASWAVGKEALGGVGKFWNTVARGAASSVISQGVGVATGLQQKFSWTGVAAAAVGSAAGHQAGAFFDDLKIGFGSKLGADLAKGTVSSMANGAAQSIVLGRRPEWGQIAVQSFGNALGDSLAQAISGEPGAPQARTSAEEEYSIEGSAKNRRRYDFVKSSTAALGSGAAGGGWEVKDVLGFLNNADIARIRAAAEAGAPLASVDGALAEFAGTAGFQVEDGGLSVQSVKGIYGRMAEYFTSKYSPQLLAYVRPAFAESGVAVDYLAGYIQGAENGDAFLREQGRFINREGNLVDVTKPRMEALARAFVHANGDFRPQNYDEVVARASLYLKGNSPSQVEAGLVAEMAARPALPLNAEPYARFALRPQEYYAGPTGTVLPNDAPIDLQVAAAREIWVESGGALIGVATGLRQSSAGVSEFPKLPLMKWLGLEKPPTIRFNNWEVVGPDTPPMTEVPKALGLEPKSAGAALQTALKPKITLNATDFTPEEMAWINYKYKMAELRIAAGREISKVGEGVDYNYWASKKFARDTLVPNAKITNVKISEVAPGYNVDEFVSRHLGGRQVFENQNWAPARVNQLMGTFEYNAVKYLPRGTPVSGFYIEWMY